MGKTFDSVNNDTRYFADLFRKPATINGQGVEISEGVLNVAFPQSAGIPDIMLKLRIYICTFINFSFVDSLYLDNIALIPILQPNHAVIYTCHYNKRTVIL